MRVCSPATAGVRSCNIGMRTVRRWQHNQEEKPGASNAMLLSSSSSSSFSIASTASLAGSYRSTASSSAHMNIAWLGCSSPLTRAIQWATACGPSSGGRSAKPSRWSGCSGMFSMSWKDCARKSLGGRKASSPAPRAARPSPEAPSPGATAASLPTPLGGAASRPASPAPSLRGSAESWCVARYASRRASCASSSASMVLKCSRRNRLSVSVESPSNHMPYMVGNNSKPELVDCGTPSSLGPAPNGARKIM
mmetsp:Transcript_116099/g.335297  ORF Transcript_116099/g.335297 Transcript_116099/m.335297 type:complete len:251 (-) Transcript_116099:1179-1931(-)